MTTARVGEGISLEFKVRQTTELTQFVKNIPSAIGTPEDYTSLSFGVMFPEELAMCGLARSERRKFPLIHKDIARAIGGLQIFGSMVDTNYGGLVACGKFAAISFDPSEELELARQRAAEVVKEHLKIRLPMVHPAGWLLPVARRTRRGSRIPKYKRAVPYKLAISGFSLSVLPEEGTKNLKSVQPYSQRPPGLRY